VSDFTRYGGDVLTPLEGATEDARRRVFAAGDRFADNARTYHVERSPRPDAVLGRHLIARGFSPGPRFADILARCRDLQDETGREDAEWLLDSVLGHVEC